MVADLARRVPGGTRTPMALKLIGGMIVLFNALLAAWLLVKPAGHALVAGVDDVAQGAGPLLIGLICLYSVRQAWGRVPGRPLTGWRGPALLALGAPLFGVGQAIYSYDELVLRQAAPLPSWADAAFLAAYPFLFLGILLLPADRLRIAARSRILADGLMIMTAIAIFSWYFILGPTLLQGSETLAAKVVSTTYPLCDLALIFCLLVLSVRVRGRTLRPIIVLLALALGIIVVTDSVYDYQNLQGTYATGGLIDVGWPLGYMLVGLSVCMLCANVRAQTGDPHKRLSSLSPVPPLIDKVSLWRALLPYAFVLAVGALLVYVWRTPGDAHLDTGVYGGAVVLIGLVLLRQVVAIGEVVSVNVTLQALHVQLESKNQTLAEANARLEALATTDPLTGLPNHRAMVAAIDQELERVQRSSQPCAVVFLDLDHFKALNDTCGHGAGDATLREFAAQVRATLRGIDTLGRWGGEEFVCLLPETDKEEAMGLAERVRAAVAGHAFAAAGGARLTCSIGFAICPYDTIGRDGLVDAADRAMYAAKRLGRNQIRVVSDPAVAALDGEVGSREETALVGTVEALAALVEARDSYTGRHTEEVAQLTVRLALTLGCDASQARMIGLAGRLHDVGKIAIPDAVLRKPGRLTDEEWGVLCTHPVVGASVVGRVPALGILTPLIRGHHEHWDGRGYPDGLAGEEIPLGARIIAVADAYGAITSDRPYRRRQDAAWALVEIRRCAGTQFDPRVVAVLERVLALDAAFAGRVDVA